ncbi:LuxR C-terminal-related transcriptional regulator [Kitasatospora sp. NPDC059673]|uniref:LuxR C-terminal-related transcriptional regulator n=1 Tax=Kitasatospora sp. NPDC059673 TaxID=3346901 RepID=UPI0036A849FC
MEISTQLDPAVARTVGTEVYRHLADHGPATPAELHAALAEDRVDLNAAVRHLLELRLVRQAPDGRLHADTPARAGLEALAPAVRDLVRHHRELQEMHSTLAALLPVYESSTLGRVSGQQVERLTDLASVRRTITELAARSTTEVLASQPGGARSEEVLNESLSRTEALLNRGVRMRTIYQHTAQFDQTTVEYVRKVTALGAEIRTVSDAFVRVLIFDRTTALIELHDEPLGAALVQDPSMIAFAVASFERAWVASDEFPAVQQRQRVRETSNNIKSAIVRMLVQGYEEKLIAKRLGMSVRTCQRHISEIMRRIGARNRLHAGYLLRDELAGISFPPPDDDLPAGPAMTAPPEAAHEEAGPGGTGLTGCGKADGVVPVPLGAVPRPAGRRTER